MPDEAKPDKDGFVDTTDPAKKNPLIKTLGGLSLEEFLSGKTKEEAEPKKEEEASENKEETKKEEVPKEEKKDEEDDSDELTSIDPSTLKTKAGVAITETARQQFEKLQSTLKAKSKKLKDAQTELEELKKKAAPQLEEQEGYKALVAERDSLRKELDLINFENSEEWQSTFHAPIKKETERVTALLGGLNLEKEDLGEVINLINQAQGLMGDAANEVKFGDVLDKIATDYMRPATAAKFTRAMENLFELSVKRAEAYADKEKAKSTIMESSRKRSASSEKDLAQRLDVELVAFSKTDVGQLFKKTPEFDYEATSKANSQKALTAIRDLIQTGQITNDLAEMLRYHALKPAFDNERKWLVNQYVTVGKAANELLKENDELKRRILELRGEGKQSEPSSKPDKEKKKDYSARGILGDKLEKFLTHVG